MEDLLQVGAITQTHGIRGEVKVFPLTDDVGRFKKGISLILDLGRSRLDLEVETVKFFKQFVILKFKGYDSINEIEKFVKKNQYVTRENAVKLKKDEYFIADLIGMTVKEEDGAILGTVSDVLQTGANECMWWRWQMAERYCFRRSRTVFFPWIWKKERCRCTCWTVCCDHKAA